MKTKKATPFGRFVKVWSKLAPKGGSVAVARQLGISSSAVLMRAAYLVKRGVELPKARRLRAPRPGDVNQHLFLDSNDDRLHLDYTNNVVRYSSDDELQEKFEAMIEEVVERRVQERIEKFIKAMR